MTDIIFNYLRVFHSVARHLSYSKAGEELNLSQPAVSRQISSLEKGLGLDLFTQRGRKVVLTDAGRSLYDYADRIMGLAQQAGRTLAQYHDLERGEVRLGVSPVLGCYLLPSILKEFYTRFPNIKVSLQLDSGQKLIKRIEDGKLDLALVVGPLESDRIHLERYTQDALVLVCPPGEDSPMFNEIFINYPLITREKPSSTRITIEDHLAKYDIRPKLIMEIPDNEVIKRLVITGIGVAFLPKRAVETELVSGALQVVKGEGTALTRWVYLVTAKDQHHCPTLLAFMNFMRKY
ncbi:transcriptional regulator, LysR family [Desulfofarcimen acetoxidans DSM 771]|uniref:Transcriptional regulator, LysR family n=1 Tax=Desulfofarcimen acetoxidans (strain ATCC 49208 / DSM 771 / KCTC 5769 / VKM B-1644 / 5575) TaxID=485916 RepID=C8W2B6_DESAS|nr:LysR family transcriptional regulator [Desulfofarcimen acetoxidans]ACV61780.1 transcriptional regulator, LysR family [Desulfofarcimen acetoxidans DSM 771]